MSEHVRVATGAPGPLARCLSGIAAAFAGDPPDGLLVLGLDDPVLPGPPPLPSGPMAVLAASGPAGPPRWAGALIAAADVVAVLHPADTEAIAITLAGRPATAVGIPRPALTEAARGLDPGGAPPAVREAYLAEARIPRDRGPGIAWVWGAGAAALVAAAEAWARGRAVIALPGTIDDPLLRRGGALMAHSTLEVIEATRLLSATEPLALSLAQRGRRAIAELPTTDEVAARLRDAVRAARGPA